MGLDATRDVREVSVVHFRLNEPPPGVPFG